MKPSALLSLLVSLPCITAQSAIDTAISIPSSVVKLADEYEHEYADFDCLFTTRDLLEHALFFAETYLYPNNSVQVESINSTMFAEDAVGRIDITRLYEGRELNTEYLFGLFVSIAADSSMTSIFGYSTSYEIYEFSGKCDEYSMAVVLNATFPLFDGLWIPFEVNIHVKLNDLKQITQYDLKFGKWPLFYDYVFKRAYGALGGEQLNSTVTLPDAAASEVGAVLAKSVCAVHEKFCTGENQQYASTYECLEFLTQDIRLGTSYEGGRNTLFCRVLHQNMVPFRPGVHCPHIGPSGGDMCLDDEASEYYNVMYNYHDIWTDNWMAV